MVLLIGGGIDDEYEATTHELLQMQGMFKEGQATQEGGCLMSGVNG